MYNLFVYYKRHNFKRLAWSIMSAGLGAAELWITTKQTIKLEINQHDILPNNTMYIHIIQTYIQLYAYYLDCDHSTTSP